MTESTRDLFDAFTRLPEAEQLAFAMEVLRWTTEHESTTDEDDDCEPSAESAFIDADADADHHL